MKNKLLLRPQEAADALGISRSGLYKLVRARKLPHVRIGNLIRIPVDQLDTFIAERSDPGLA